MCTLELAVGRRSHRRTVINHFSAFTNCNANPSRTTMQFSVKVIIAVCAVVGVAELGRHSMVRSRSCNECSLHRDS